MKLTPKITVVMSLVMLSFVFSAAAQDKAKPYPESLQEWVDGGKYIKFEGLDIFVHSSGRAPVDGHGVLVVHGFPGSSWDFANVYRQSQKRPRSLLPT